MRSSVYSRIEKLQKQLKSWKVDGCIIEHPLDLFYLTGLKLSAGSLIVDSKEFRLFVDGRYLAMVEKKLPVSLSVPDASRLYLKKRHIQKLAFDSAKTSFLQVQQLKKWKIPLAAEPHLLRELRMIKESGEIKKMKESARLNFAAYEHIAKKLKVGISELELAQEYQIFCLREGAEGVAFEPIVAFGKNAALPHHRAGKAVYREGEIALFDLGTMLDSYASDMTRVYLPKNVHPKMRQFYETVRMAQRSALDLCKSGMQVGKLDEAARNEMAKKGFEKYYVHSLGHGVGLDVHEYPTIRLKDKIILQPGMVITIEPGLYLPGVGGVRYEDTVLITKSGYTNFYPEVP